ncbi:hypothetical protein [uncultured Erythrobacter sp.]|uniref:hypothetical protein n=1 Tax=uncultured Erythrobacter sp. TaxID=263913 RepID=UPI00261FA773|nr:hypothetical protein [uncultured Erythrobacter sp.]
MIISIAATVLLALLAMAPGWLLMHSKADRSGQFGAAMAASLTVVMLVTALIGTVWHAATGGQIPAASMAGVSVLGIVIVGAFIRRGAAYQSPSPPLVIEWEAFALAAGFVAFGFLSMALAIATTPDGDLLIHSWYNADWFKHIGHVHAIANSGLPARDIFGGNEPLYYYWLSYTLPGAGAALGGDTWAALATANAIITALFCFVFYGLLRFVAPRRSALLIASLGLFIIAPLGFFIALFGDGLQALLDVPQAPKGPALMTIAQFIPQHSLAATVLVGWAVLAYDRPERGSNTPHHLALAALAALLPVSTLLGATLLIGYGFIELYRRRLAAVPELAIMVVAVGVLAALLNVVQLGNPDSALESPLLNNPEDIRPWFERASNGGMLLFGYCGVPLFAAVVALVRWKPTEPTGIYARAVAFCLILASFVAVVGTQALAPERLAAETLIRAVIPAAIGTSVIGAWAFAAAMRSEAKYHYGAMAAIAAMTIIAAPGIYVRMAWMTDLTDDWTTRIPANDRGALADLRRLSDPQDQVWQFPEPPILARERGHDSWSATIAGRAVPNSERATDFTIAAKFIDQSKRFFEGEDVPIPEQVEWIYLSRILAPDGYEVTKMRLVGAPEWKMASCYADACLFQRRESSSQ